MRVCLYVCANGWVCGVCAMCVYIRACVRVFQECGITCIGCLVHLSCPLPFQPPLIQAVTAIHSAHLRTQLNLLYLFFPSVLPSVFSSSSHIGCRCRSHPSFAYPGQSFVLYRVFSHPPLSSLPPAPSLSLSFSLSSVSSGTGLPNLKKRKALQGKKAVVGGVAPAATPFAR